MCSEADRVETMALDLECGMSFPDRLEEKPEAVRRRSRRRDVIKETSETQQKVFTVFEYMRTKENVTGHTYSLPDEYTWNALLTAIYKADRYEDVLQLFDMTRSESLCGMNGYLYKRALMSCPKLGCWEKAVKLLYEMEGSGLAVSTPSYNLVISACEKSRQSKVALRVYEHMVQRECKADTFTYLSLVRSCIWGSLWDEVKDILKKAEPDVSLYNAAIHAWDVFKT
ncbi:hypothetical protein F2Q68_00011836 [Brassica cretica]|uniref:Pentacotripeptide-repeat region of PRORP domain-containing protein n=1 Tax=Brassica cretica TaxID=69181 RepID=A0A8S9KY22_BRACR|nr:hypothetical protein F2Q68_00011836 [Brassica cretica]